MSDLLHSVPQPVPPRLVAHGQLFNTGSSGAASDQQCPATPTAIPRHEEVRPEPEHQGWGFDPQNRVQHPLQILWRSPHEELWAPKYHQHAEKTSEQRIDAGVPLDFPSLT